MAVLSKPLATLATKLKPQILSKRMSGATVTPVQAKPGPRPAQKLNPAPIPGTLAKLKKAYPDAHCELTHENAFQLLIATILSAQCTDARVNLVTPELFRRFPNASSMALASLEVLESLIGSINFYRNKSKSLKNCAGVLTQKYHGEVPREMDRLVELPGVGRKTANCVLGNAFNIPLGVVVDTHVARLSFRFGWTKSDNPGQIETELMKSIPKDDWILIAHLLIFHGRRICSARAPKCDECFLFDLCPKHGVK